MQGCAAAGRLRGDGGCRSWGHGRARHRSGRPQPKDVPAAKAAVIQAFADAFTPSNSQEVKDAAKEDPTLVDPLGHQAATAAMQGGYSADQLAGLMVSIGDVVFTDQTHATVQLSLTIPGHGTVISDRTEHAVFVDGRWKVARQTSCDLLSVSIGGVRCPS